MYSLIAIMFVALTIPPAAKVLAVCGSVYTIIQILKQAPWFKGYLNGWIAIVVNLLFTILAVTLTIPADQLYSMNTAFLILTTVLGSAGIHGTVSALNSQSPNIPPPNAGN